MSPPKKILPIQWSELGEDERRRIQESFVPPSMFLDLVRYNNSLVMPRLYADQLAERIYNFVLREDDIWVLSYPKTGTTWTTELVWMLINDVDTEKSEGIQISRVPFLETECLFPIKSLELRGVKEHGLEFANRMEGRRLIRSHLPLEFLPPGLLEKCKVVYVARNPKDACVSYYHHNLSLPNHCFTGNFQQFADLFEEGLHAYGSYWHHLLGGWAVRDHPNVKMVWFEDMKRDQLGVIRDLCSFLQHPLTGDQMEMLADYVKFENMKKNPNTNPTGGIALPEGKTDFVRKGKVGDWKNYFDQKRTEKWNKWINDNISGTGLDQLEIFKDN